MNTTLKSLIRTTTTARSRSVSTATKSIFTIKTQQIHTSGFNANKNNIKPSTNTTQAPKEEDSAWQRFRRIFAKTMMVSKDELTRGNMWEYHQLKKYPDGKVFPAQTLKSPVPFPLFEIRRIYDLNRQLVKLKQYFAAAPHGVTFVICSQKREFASKIIQSWKKAFQEKFPEVTCAELISVPLSYRIANPLLKSILKRTNKPEDWPNVLQIKEAWIDMSPKALGGVDMENSFLGYAFVVDKNSNIHWRAVGMAKDYELDSLFKVVADLKQQHAKQQEQPPAKNDSNTDTNTAEKGAEASKQELPK